MLYIPKRQNTDINCKYIIDNFKIYNNMARTKELTIEEKLKVLYELQQVDSKIDALRTLAGELPQEVKDMADEVEGLKTRLVNIENDIKECETQIPGTGDRGFAA